jgi:hypothetical protein
MDEKRRHSITKKSLAVTLADISIRDNLGGSLHGRRNKCSELVIVDPWDGALPWQSQRL